MKIIGSLPFILDVNLVQNYFCSDTRCHYVESPSSKIKEVRAIFLRRLLMDLILQYLLALPLNLIDFNLVLYLIPTTTSHKYIVSIRCNLLIC